MCPGKRQLDRRLCLTPLRVAVPALVGGLLAFFVLIEQIAAEPDVVPEERDGNRQIMPNGSGVTNFVPDYPASYTTRTLA